MQQWSKFGLVVEIFGFSRYVVSYLRSTLLELSRTLLSYAAPYWAPPHSIVLNKFALMQVAHFSLLSSFPFFSVGSPSFLAAMLMVLVNHYLAFSFFGENYYPFSEVS
jgi:hypothetical protein